eukprot:354234-Chlamydomonas_euryale.AAC.8
MLFPSGHRVISKAPLLGALAGCFREKNRSLPGKATLTAAHGCGLAADCGLSSLSPPPLLLDPDPFARQPLNPQNKPPTPRRHT